MRPPILVQLEVWNEALIGTLVLSNEIQDSSIRFHR